MNWSGPAAPEERVVRRTGLLARGFWLCPVISLVLAATVLIRLGVNRWAALVAAGPSVVLFPPRGPLAANRPGTAGSDPPPVALRRFAEVGAATAGEGAAPHADL